MSIKIICDGDLVMWIGFEFWSVNVWGEGFFWNVIINWGWGCCGI